MTADPAFDAVTRARNKADGGNPRGAAEILEQYLMTDPHNTAVRIELARITAYHLGDKRGAEFQLDIVLDMEPDNTDALKASVTVRQADRAQQKLVDAQFNRLIGISEGRDDRREAASVYSAYAVFLRKTAKDYAKAAEMYEKAISADPDRYEFHQDYAVLLLNEFRDYVKARHELEEVLRLKPRHLDAKRNLDRLIATKFDADGNVRLNFLERRRIRHN